MAALGTRRVRSDPDVEINMVPIMNMFLVLIPFLLMSASFLHLKAIDTSVPVRAQPDPSLQKVEKPSDIIVTAVVKLSYDDIRVSITSGELPESQLQKYDSKVLWTERGDEEMEGQLASLLSAIKSEYPKSSTLILSPADDVVYEDIVKVMDIARRQGQEKLFPVVVVSGEVAPG